jgi:hypothetical protein
MRALKMAVRRMMSEVELSFILQVESEWSFPLTSGAVLASELFDSDDAILSPPLLSRDTRRVRRYHG